MDATQLYTAFGLSVSVIGSTFVFYGFIRSDMKEMRGDMKVADAKWEANRRETDAKWANLFALFIAQRDKN